MTEVVGLDIVIAEPMDAAGFDLLASVGTVVYRPDLWRHPPQLAAAVEQATALLVRNQTRVDARLIGPALRVVGRLGVGLDNLDLPALRQAGVTVVAARGANAVAVAEYVLGYCWFVLRPLHRYQAQVRWDRDAATGSELFRQTLGIVGLGDIGRRLAVRARALGMKVLGHDPFLGPYDMAWQDLGVEAVDLRRLLASSDFVSVHVPLTSATEGLIGGPQLAWMKPTAHLIHTARGGVVDEDALYAVLSSGQLAGAALDVRRHEPARATDRFRALPNVMLTPHIAGVTRESAVRTATLVAEDVARVLRGESPRTAVG